MRIELDRHDLGEGIGLDHVKEISDILDKYQLTSGDCDLFSFPYFALLRSISKGSSKRIRTIDEFALEMGNLREELSSCLDNSDKLKKMRSFLCDFSKELREEFMVYQRPYFLAAV